jgi:hypothetical protein
MPDPNRATVKTQNTGVQAGIDKHMAGPVTVGGTAYDAASLKAVFQTHSDALDEADALYKRWRDQVQVARKAGATRDRVYGSLRSYLLGQHGRDAHAVLNDFAMEAPRATGPKTVKAKADAADKSLATRKARHTMGKRQKEGIHGTVTATAPATGGAAVTDAAGPAATPDVQARAGT